MKLLFILIILSGCAISQKTKDRFESYCEFKGGPAYIEQTLTGHKGICNNGEVLEF